MTTQRETAGKTPADIEREIEATRDRMSGDIDAIGEKFTPEHIKYRAREAIHGAREAAMDRVQEVANDVGRKTREAGNGLLEMMRNNPVPAAMIGAGVAWLMMDGRSRSAKMRRYGGRYDRMGYRYSEPDNGQTGESAGALQTVKEKAESLTGQARDKAGEKIQHAGERIQQFREEAMEKARYAESELESFFERSPLIAAAGIAVLGAAIGVMLPRTEPEDRLLGSMSDRVAEKARETAREVTERAKGAAQGAVETFTENFDKTSGQPSTAR